MELSKPSFRCRALKTEKLTQQLREHRKKRVATSTYDALQKFEDSLKAQQEAATRAMEEIPVSADVLSRQHSGQNIGLQNSLASRSRSEPVLKKSIADDPRTRKPPTPLQFYDYGSISPKSRSVVSQLRQKSCGESTTPSGGSVYFPGVHFRQGTYGDKLLEPCLMPPTSATFASSTTPSRRHGASDIRPLASQEFQVGRHWTQDGPCSPIGVRSNASFEQRARRTMQVMQRLREESLLEYRLFQDGTFGGIWRDPTLSGQTSFEISPPSEVSWICLAAEMYRSPGQKADFQLNPSQMSAFRLLAGIEFVLHVTRCRLSDLFAAENKGVKGVLELDEFCHAVHRLGLWGYEDVSKEEIFDAMTALDPCFDGQVCVATLAQALKVFGASSTEADKTAQDLPGSTYGKAAPVKVVRMELDSKSIKHFTEKFAKFREQQRQLLEQYQEKFSH